MKSRVGGFGGFERSGEAIAASVEAGTMCPLRVILLFLSAMLAGYFAIKTVRTQGQSSILELGDEEPEKVVEHTGLLAKVSVLGFWSVAELGVDQLNWS